MARTIKGGSINSMNTLKKSLKKSAGGGGQRVVRLKDGEPLTIRFLTEPSAPDAMDAWREYFEHFDDTRSGSYYFPCTGDSDCDGCGNGLRASKRYLANVVDVDENKAIVIVLPVTLAEAITRKYEKFKTLLDRNYEVAREGSGQDDTKYFVDHEDPSKMSIARFTKSDLTEILLAQLDEGGTSADDDDDEDDEKPVRRGKVAKKVAKKRPIERKSSRDDDDEDEDDDDDEDDDEAPIRRRRVAKKVAPARKKVARKVASPPKKKRRIV